MSAELNLQLSGNTFKHIGFFHSGGNPVVKGWWEYQNGCEGGELNINTVTAQVEDFDGEQDLPKHIIKELASFGVSYLWADD